MVILPSNPGKFDTFLEHAEIKILVIKAFRAEVQSHSSNFEVRIKLRHVFKLVHNFVKHCHSFEPGLVADLAPLCKPDQPLEDIRSYVVEPHRKRFHIFLFSLCLCVVDQKFDVLDVVLTHSLSDHS